MFKIKLVFSYFLLLMYIFRCIIFSIKFRINQKHFYHFNQTVSLSMCVSVINGKCSYFTVIIIYVYIIHHRKARIELMKIHTKDNKIVMSEEDWTVLGEQTEGYSGSDLANLTLESLFCPIRELQTSKKWKQKGRTSLVENARMLKKNPYAILVRNYHNKSLCKTFLSEYFMIKRFYDGTNISFRSLFNQHNESGEIL